MQTIHMSKIQECSPERKKNQYNEKEMEIKIPLVLIIQSQDYWQSSGVFFFICEKTASLPLKAMSFQKLSTYFKSWWHFSRLEDKNALPRSCDQWRCPCWTGPAPRTRTTCCSGPRGWEWAHR